MLFAPATVTNLQFQNNIAGSESTGIFITFSQVTISNSVFNTTLYPNNLTNSTTAAAASSLFGWYISISAGATVTITNSNFDNGYAINGGAIYVSGNSDLTLNTCNFNGCASKSYGGAIYATGFNSFSASNCQFSKNMCEISGCDLYLNSGVASLINTKVSITSSQTSIYLVSGNFEATNLSMANIQPRIVKTKNLFGAGIYVLNMNAFTLSNSNFTNLNYAEYGGAIYLLGSTSSSKQVTSSPSWVIKSCTFIGNSAFNGGAIYIDSIDYTVINASIFTNNSVSSSDSQNGYGGAIYYLSSGKKLS